MEKFIKMFKALSDETRLRIYLLLLREKLCVCEIVNILNIEQSRVSHCLRILKEANLISCCKKGIWMIYSANPKVLKSKLVEGIKKEIPILSSDLKRLNRCKKTKIREKCKTKFIGKK